MTDATSNSNHSNTEKNQGEGNREAARRFNRSAGEFVESEEGKRASEADHELSGEQKREAEEAEKKARRHAREKDPQVTRDYSRAEK